MLLAKLHQLLQSDTTKRLTLIPKASTVKKRAGEGREGDQVGLTREGKKKENRVEKERRLSDAAEDANETAPTNR